MCLYTVVFKFQNSDCVEFYCDGQIRFSLSPRVTNENRGNVDRDSWKTAAGRWQLVGEMGKGMPAITEALVKSSLKLNGKKNQFVTMDPQTLETVLKFNRRETVLKFNRKQFCNFALTFFSVIIKS